MSKRKVPEKEDIQPQISPVKAIELLKVQIQKGEKLLSSSSIEKDDYSAWEMVTRNFLEKAFGTNSPNVSAITSVGKYGSFPMNAGENWWGNHRAKSLTTQLKKLEGLIELLLTEAQLEDGEPIKSTKQKFGNQIFLVHGHNHQALLEVARFLEKLDQSILILHEQPNQGRTLIEKFEDYSNVGFAVVLLTPDDKGGSVEVKDDQQKCRARQNVIFELGYFIGKLGRNRVCALYVPGIEIPSDFTGVLYVELDDKNAWRLTLARELKAAGFSIDMNKAF